MRYITGLAWFVLALALSACCCPLNFNAKNNPAPPLPEAEAKPIAKVPDPAPPTPDDRKDPPDERKSEEEAPIDPEPRLAFALDPRMNFGLTVLKDAGGKPVNKLLTYSRTGETNHTMIRIDGKDATFGDFSGKWLQQNARDGLRSASVWQSRGVKVIQILEIVPSKQAVEVAPGVRKRILDTCLIRYELENTDTKPHSVGLRIMVDTLIGSNDGVPFTVPTMQGLVNTFKDFPTADVVPDFVQALEVPNLSRPGTVGHMTIKIGAGIEPPSRVSLTRWPGSNAGRWDIGVIHMANDSAVVLYWNADRSLNPGERRVVGFAYGLGQVSGGEGQGKLALTVNGAFNTGSTFTVTAYVSNPAPNQTLTLELPAGFERTRGDETERVPAAAPGQTTSTVTWTVRAGELGQYQLRVRSSNGLSQTQPIAIVRSN